MTGTVEKTMYFEKLMVQGEGKYLVIHFRHSDIPQVKREFGVENPIQIIGKTIEVDLPTKRIFAVPEEKEIPNKKSKGIIYSHVDLL